MDVTIYSTESCGYCRRAEDLLRRRGVPFRKIDVTHDWKLRDELVERAEGRRTVPVIFFGETPIGGYQELAALDAKGMLLPLAATATASAAASPTGPGDPEAA